MLAPGPRAQCRLEALERIEAPNDLLGPLTWMTAGMAVAHFAHDPGAGSVALVRLDGENDGPFSTAGFDRQALEVRPVGREDTASTANNPPANSEQVSPVTEKGTTFVFADLFGDPLAGSNPFRSLFPESGTGSGMHNSLPAEPATGGGGGSPRAMSGLDTGGHFGAGGAGAAGSGSPSAASPDR